MAHLDTVSKDAGQNLAYPRPAQCAQPDRRTHTLEKCAKSKINFLNSQWPMRCANICVITADTSAERRGCQHTLSRAAQDTARDGSSHLTVSSSRLVSNFTHVN